MRVKLFKGKATVVGRKSEHSLYSKKLATYETGDQFDHDAAKGFIRLHGLASRRRRACSCSRMAVASICRGCRTNNRFSRERQRNRWETYQPRSLYVAAHRRDCTHGERNNGPGAAGLLLASRRAQVSKMASRGHLPGQKSAAMAFRVGGDQSLDRNADGDLQRSRTAGLETGTGRGQGDTHLPLTSLLSESTIALPLAGARRPGSSRSWWTWPNPGSLRPRRPAHGGQTREDRIDGFSCWSGPPRSAQPSPTMLGEPVVAFGRRWPVCRSARRGGPQRHLFPGRCREQRTHLKLLAVHRTLGAQARHGGPSVLRGHISGDVANLGSGGTGAYGLVGANGQLVLPKLPVTILRMKICVGTQRSLLPQIPQRLRRAELQGRRGQQRPADAEGHIQIAAWHVQATASC